MRRIRQGTLGLANTNFMKFLKTNILLGKEII